jgi:2-polyprenyl-3-methyl-5-hydroxy-6-metoxy-1,4-benzoquinol methylase
MLDALSGKIADRGLSNITACFLDLQNGDVLKGRYHLIVSSMTFHHVREIAPLLTAFHTSLHPGGRLCVADLDLDGGQFHTNDDGVFHHGFDRASLHLAFTEAGFHDVSDRTAATVTKPGKDGKLRQFTVFLMAGSK